MDATHIRNKLERLRRLCIRQHLMLEMLMTDNDDLNATIADLSATVDAYEAKVAATDAALNATIATLQAQLASGPAGLTDAQVKAAITALGVIKAKMVAPVIVASGGVLSAGPATLAMKVGTAAPLAITAADSTGKAIATPALTFVSDTPKVATVDAAGNVAAVAAGAATITVSSPNFPSVTVVVQVS